MAEYIKVKGHDDLVRDTHSKAIINRNRSAYEIAKRRAAEANWVHCCTASEEFYSRAYYKLKPLLFNHLQNESRVG